MPVPGGISFQIWLPQGVRTGISTMTLESIPDSPLRTIIQDHKRGQPTGVFSICSAHPTVLETCLQVALGRGRPILIESTCNQVNQDGGYMGLIPRQFAAYVHVLAEHCGFPEADLILGGDHLGPYPWRNLPAEQAMVKARQMVIDYVQAGYSKIHLDASMPCADELEKPPLDPEQIASRTADLCYAAEESFRNTPGNRKPPLYVIGTEVPSPGGIQDVVARHQGKTDSKQAADGEIIPATRPEDALQTIELTRSEFLRRGLDSAWERVVALVVQPGVEFGDQKVHPYDRHKATELSNLILRFENLVYEAHSTDYQTPLALKQLVEDHFAILKVGPALTFAYREAVFALSWIEAEWLGNRAGLWLSDLPETLTRVMQAQPDHWHNFYQGNLDEVRLALKYSYSDRSRYYWTHPEVQAAISRLYENLTAFPPPLALLSQFMPEQYRRLREGSLPHEPAAWIRDRIADSLRPYLRACGWIQDAKELL